jgi:hypothetical protein
MASIPESEIERLKRGIPATSSAKAGKALSSDQHRIVIDQLVMAYGISGQLKKAHELLDEAISQDPITR